MKHETRRKRKEDVASRVSRPNSMYSYCRIIGCPNPASAGTSKGLNRLYCRKHEDHFERHGSYVRGSYSAAQINPYRSAALEWLAQNPDRPGVRNAIAAIERRYRTAGPKVEAFRLRGLKPVERARAAWARLREAGVDPQRPVAAWLAVELMLKEDATADRSAEYKRVQAAKLVHRMASGSHKRWEQERAGQHIVTVELHKYPASRGQVLRHLGTQLEKVTELLVDWHLQEILRAVETNIVSGS